VPERCSATPLASQLGVLSVTICWSLVFDLECTAVLYSIRSHGRVFSSGEEGSTLAAPEATPAVDGGFRLQLRRTAPLGRAACCRLPRTRHCIGSGVEFSGLLAGRLSGKNP